MPDKAWKARERKAAALIGAKRQPLSGSAGRDDRSRSDSTHDRIFLETKHRSRTAIRSLYEATKQLARKEGKVPVLAVADKGRPGFLFVVHSDDIHEFVDAIKGVRWIKNNQP